jgi:hypothetical protein
VLNCDECFFKFYHESQTVIAMKGSKRVGRNKSASNEKLGCSVMVTLDMMQSRILPPFIVFDGAKRNEGGRLVKDLDQWTGTAKLTCQKSHWFDSDIVMIPEGMTAIMLSCDLFANKPLKAFVKHQFGEWRVEKVKTVAPGGKYKVIERS